MFLLVMDGRGRPLLTVGIEASFGGGDHKNRVGQPEIESGGMRRSPNASRIKLALLEPLLRTGKARTLDLHWN
jgi:hypothetical protein